MALFDVLIDGKLTDDEKKYIKNLSDELNLEDDDIAQVHKYIASIAYGAIIKDQRITDEEKKHLEDISDFLEIELEDFDFDQNEFNKYYVLDQLDKGILVPIDRHDLDIIFKKNETLHWACGAELNTIKRVSNKLSYKGITGSIRIMKGLRYRAGSIDYSYSTSEHLIAEDNGVFWITNQRIGFHGNRKSFAIAISKIHSLQVNSDSMFVFKDGREKPYILCLDDYDVPGMMLSHLLNTN